MRHHVRVGFDLLQEARLFQLRDDQLARGEAILAVEFFGKDQRGFRQAAQIVLVGGQRHTRFLIEHADRRKIVTAADLEVVEVVGRGDLHRARTLLRVGVIVGDDRNQPSHQRQYNLLADNALVTLVLGIHGDSRVAQHGFGPRGRDHDEGGRVLGIELLAFERIAQMPEAALDLDLLHFEIGDRGQQLRVPVDQTLVLVDQSLRVEFDEHLGDCA